MRCDEREAKYILAALRSLRQTPPVADGPGVSLIAVCGDGEPQAIAHARCARPEEADPPHEDEAITSSFLRLPQDNSHRQWSPGEEPYNENITRHEVEPAFSGSVIVATSLHAVDRKVDPNHDADIRIGSEAPKQRCPFLIAA